MRAVNARGLSAIERGSGHVQIIGGPLLVNYYPESKRRSAYVAGATSKRTGVTPEQAVEMCFTAPPKRGVRRKDRRTFSGSSDRRRRILKWLRRKYGDDCRWCDEPMIFSGDDDRSATIEHIIPLDRGGLDNMNNMALAHKKCNHDRANNMPELEA